MKYADIDKFDKILNEIYELLEQLPANEQLSMLAGHTQRLLGLKEKSHELVDKFCIDIKYRIDRVKSMRSGNMSEPDFSVGKYLETI